MRFLTKLLAIVFAITLIAFIFLFYMNNFLVVDQELSQAEAIVVMMGDALGRVPEVADVYMAGYAQTVIMVQGANSDEISDAKRDAINLGISEENIIVLPGQATSTWAEAEIVSAYLAERRDINSLILINSGLQTRRTLVAFKRVLGCLDRDIQLISRASRYIKVDQESLLRESCDVRWWQDRRSCRELIIESAKYFHYLLRALSYKGCEDVE